MKQTIHAHRSIDHPLLHNHNIIVVAPVSGTRAAITASPTLNMKP
ncbi:MAG TPA: hypothetical protein VIN08_22595 [Ohtaekwangia sp.]